ncbi:MAG: sensor histidine kinase [Bacteroidetes bacterium]|nr:sensor histidine kinase [Bacteroidota bacterium]
MKLRAAIISLLFTQIVNAQIDPQKFMQKFNDASLKGKVRLVASVDYNEIKSIYPLIQDTLLKIKQLVYKNSESKEAKFLFDKIDADIEISNQNYAKAIFILRNSIESHAQDSGDSLKILQTLKYSFIQIKDYYKAFEINHEIEKITLREKHTKNNNTDKSTLYNLLGLPLKAIKERRTEYLKIAKPGIRENFNYYNDIGVFYNKAKMSDSAEVYFKKALQEISKVEDNVSNEKYKSFCFGLVNGNLGLSYYNQGKLYKAIPLLKIDAYYSKKNNFYESAYNAYDLLAKTYINLEEAKSAKLFIDTLNLLNSENNFPIKITLSSYLTLANYYSLIGEAKKSSDKFLRYISLKDSTESIEKDRQLLNEELAFSVQQKELELNEKNKSIEESKINDAKQKTFKAYLLAGLLMLLAATIFLILNYNYSRKREKVLESVNTKINAQNTLIEQSLKEKELLIKEIHHRVKNNLQIITSMLSLQIGKLNDKKSEVILQEAKQRINSIALTHQMLYQKDNLSSVLINDYILKLATQIESTIPTNQIELILDVDPLGIRLSIDNAVPLGLLFNEILTNAYKHAFPNNVGEIIVSLKKGIDSFSLSIKDNGKGISDDLINPENSSSMGMELIHILADQLDTNLIINNQNGTEFKIIFKKF